MNPSWIFRGWTPGVYVAFVLYNSGLTAKNPGLKKWSIFSAGRTTCLVKYLKVGFHVKISELWYKVVSVLKQR